MKDSKVLVTCPPLPPFGPAGSVLLLRDLSSVQAWARGAGPQLVLSAPSSPSTARAECPYWDLGWPTGRRLPGQEQRQAAGCGPGRAASAGCSCCLQARGCDGAGMRPGSSPRAAGRPSLGRPSPPSGSAGALAQAGLLSGILRREGCEGTL